MAKVYLGRQCTEEVGKEIPLARKEEKRRTVLLVSSCARRIRKETICREARP